MEENKFFHLLKAIQNITLNINEDNILFDVQVILSLFDDNFSYSFNLIICKSLYSSFASRITDFNLCFEFLKAIEKNEKELTKSNYKILDIFAQFLLTKSTQESDYLLEKLLEQNIISSEIVKNKSTLYFAQYKTLEEIKNSDYLEYETPFWNDFFDNYEQISKDNFKLHKQLTYEGVNPLKLAIIIRNDEIEKLQKLSSSQNEFDYNQKIKPSLYERYTFINNDTISLIDYAAFFGSIKCFKFLFLNGSNTTNTGKYAIAGGNLEIIHICEGNKVIFKDACDAAIEYHRNDIFKYIYENKIFDIKYLNDLVRKCILYNNYELLKYFIDKGIEIDDSIINEAAKNGNLFLVKYFFEENYIPNDILVSITKSGNIELFKYILEQRKVNINIKDI